MNQPSGARGYRIRVALVDDHAILRQSLRILLESRDVVDIVAEFDDGRDAVSSITSVAADVVLMDLAMPRLNGIEATRLIRRESPTTKVIILSSYGNADQLRESLRAGASGYIVKRSDVNELVLAIQTVHLGNTYFSSALAQQFDIGAIVQEARTTRTETGLDRLTGREREVLQLVVEGQTTQQIADELVISLKTVEGHKTKIMGKLQIRNRVELVRFALDAGIVVDESRLSAPPSVD